MVVKFRNEDYSYMQQAFDLALRGWGKVAPNPMVGAVLVKNDHVVGKGYHRRCGSAHAEVEAIRDAGNEAKGATLYLNLEPCNHRGKTPPCTQAIIQSGIKKVVCSNRDINRNVKRSGFRILRSQGIEVQTGLMRKEGRRLNEIYFKHINTGKPFVTLKAALSLDGYIYSSEFENRYLSGKPFLKFVHYLRAGYDAVLIGARTAMVDNPSLNLRLVKGRDPIRIILSDGIPLSSDLSIFNIESNAPTIVAVSSKADRVEYHKDAVVWTIRSETRNFKLEPLIERAAKEGITSILVEGGGAVYDNFLREKAVDKIILSHTPYIYGSGVPFSSGMGFNESSGILTFKEFHWEKIGNDSVFIGYPDFGETD